MSRQKLSVVLATKNEEGNIGDCLRSVKGLAEEIIVFDEFSTDKTKEIAKKYGAKVFEYQHKTNFHETKQKAIDSASCDWILQLDADERVGDELRAEIESVLLGDHEDYKRKLPKGELKKKTKLFLRHQKLVQKRGSYMERVSDDVVAYFIPRLNYFLGKPLWHAGVYPDGVIRLFKKGRARLPGKSVHELMEVDGKIGWLYCELQHHESPAFSRYLRRANRYTDLTAEGFRSKYAGKSSSLLLSYYSFIKPFLVFLNLYIKHKGFLDGVRGFVWSAFSAFHYPIAYFKYHQSTAND